MGRGKGVFSGGLLAVVAVCCGAHTLLLGALGGLALGGLMGVGAGALGAVVLVAGILFVRRRRAVACATAREERPVP